MIDFHLVTDLVTTLAEYQRATSKASDPQSVEDYSRLVVITENLIVALRSKDVPAVKLGLLGFSRQVSDAFSIQPPEFKPLAEKIAELKRQVL